MVLTQGSDTNKTLLYYDDGTGNPDIAHGAIDLSGVNGVSGNTTDGYTGMDRVRIYGGCETDECASTKITMLGGVIYEIDGGGYNGNVTGDTHIKITGGKSSYIRGGSGTGNVGGSTYIDISNHEVTYDVSGGGTFGHVAGSANVTLGQDVQIGILHGKGNVYGGGWSGGGVGDVNIHLTGNASVNNGIYGSMKGGDTRYPVNGDVSILLEGTSNALVIAGADPTDSPVIKGNVTIEMRDSTGTSEVVAAYSNADVDGDITLRFGQSDPRAWVGKIKGAKDVTGKSTSIFLGNGTDPRSMAATGLYTGTYDLLLLRKNAVIEVTTVYESLNPGETQLIKPEEYIEGIPILDTDPTNIPPVQAATAELFKIVQPAGVPAGTWYVDSSSDFADWGKLRQLPLLSNGRGERISDAEAKLLFSANKAGTCYYSIADEGAQPPAVDTSTGGQPCGAGDNTLRLTGLAKGGKTVALVLKDQAGKISDPLIIHIPRRTNIRPAQGDNAIKGIVEGQNAVQGQKLAFEAVGAGMDNDVPLAGDERFKPYRYTVGDVSGSWTDGPYAAELDTSGFAPGSYTLTVSFIPQRYESRAAGEQAAWHDVAGASGVTKSVTFTVAATSHEVISAPEPDTGKTPPTGDDSDMNLWLLLLAAAGAVIAVALLHRGRRHRRH